MQCGLWSALNCPHRSGLICVLKDEKSSLLMYSCRIEQRRVVPLSRVARGVCHAQSFVRLDGGYRFCSSP